MRVLINSTVLSQMAEIFKKHEFEQGFLLGSIHDLCHIDRCCYVPPVSEGKYFYEPDATFANRIIQNWLREGVCPCGLIHSHTAGQKALSPEDISFAKKLYTAFHLPFIWFGIGVITNNNVDFYFYSTASGNGELAVLPAITEVTEIL